jgi:hypothetical protein
MKLVTIGLIILMCLSIVSSCSATANNVEKVYLNIEDCHWKHGNPMAHCVLNGFVIGYHTIEAVGEGLNKTIKVVNHARVLDTNEAYVIFNHNFDGKDSASALDIIACEFHNLQYVFRIPRDIQNVDYIQPSFTCGSMQTKTFNTGFLDKMKVFNSPIFSYTGFCGVERKIGQTVYLPISIGARPTMDNHGCGIFINDKLSVQWVQ